MKSTLGNYLIQSNKDFPVDAETFDYIQRNQALLAVLGNLAGDKAILLGCEPEQNDTRRREGYVFIRTKEFPEGEILYWEGGSVAAGMYLKKEPVAVTAQGYEFPQAYVVRSLAPGIGEENYKWEEFTQVDTLPTLRERIRKQDETLVALQRSPLGIVQMWAGAAVPAGYELCDGRELKIDEYKELYAALGTTFNRACDCNGNVYNTTQGYFRLPDLRGRFIVGYHPSDADYDSYGEAGGEKQHQLTVDEMPAHAHPTKDYYFAESYGNGATLTGVDHVGKSVRGSGKSDGDNDYLYYYTHATESQGGDAQHENRPPYYVLAYIMRMK
ncbi:MAG: phage tail protein [Alistipes senegalensis]|nr:phage tail protein [Bacteroides cellulosilyticus]MCM1351334.1 phage tail protein [Alistipes senegalensis]